MRALTGVRVLDLSRFVAGPFCCQILGDHGADVIKVEKADGEPARHIPPFLKDESLYFFAYNGSKRGITVNFRSEAGLRLLRQLILKADVVVENFRAGTMEKMGLGYASLAQEHPGLILVSVSGFGTEGPYAGLPAFDEIIQTMSGLSSLTGEAAGPPLLTGTYVADFLTGVYAALGAVLALQSRGTERARPVGAHEPSAVSRVHPEHHGQPVPHPGPSACPEGEPQSADCPGESLPRERWVRDGRVSHARHVGGPGPGHGARGSLAGSTV